MKAASSSGSLAIVAGFFKRGTGPTPATIFQVSLVRFQYLSLVATIDELGRTTSLSRRPGTLMVSAASRLLVHKA